jgi:heavy metal sensor kinase
MTGAARKLWGFTRGLRFRLALSYVFFFTLLLVLLGLVFHQTLGTAFQSQMGSVLNEEWGAAKGYLRTGPEGPDWFYDSDDPDESFTVERLRRVFLLADTQGHALQRSAIYRSLGIDTPADVQAILESGKPAIRVRTDPATGIPYMIRSGLWVDQHGHKYYLSIGRALDYNNKVINDFTRNYFALVPILIVLSSLLGWFLAGRALSPVNSVAEAAQKITHSSLHMQIPLRRAGDELDRLIEAFNHMMSRLNRSFEQIRQFSTDVSHELRTPLTVARGQLEVALFTAQTVDEHREAMAEALEGIDRLSNIVRALLLLSQSETGQLTLQKADLDLAELARDLVDQHQIPAEAEGVRLSADLPASAMIYADRVQIERMLSNLLGNAIKYTPAGGRVVVRLGAEGGQIRLVVEDTGVGIAPDHLPHIFDRFYRVPSADPEKGLGLGLSFVAWIVKAHDGTVDVESKLQEGTRFTVSLPAVHPQDLPAETPAAITEQVH